jgi:CubicO group peptidase (beta-lactamase class C family)
LRQLLSHTSGVRPYLPAPRVDNYNHLDSAVTEILPLDTVFAPGIRFEYGGLAMQIAGRMAEVAMGEEFEFLFQKLIAVPLEMTGSHFTPVNTDGGHAPMLGGGLCTTLNDYIRFLKMIYHNGRFGNKEILKPETVQTMQADQVRNAVVAPGEYVEKALGQHHTGIYGLGEWRELVDETTGEAYQISSPGWAGAYPWINKRDSVYGFFIAHVQGGANKKDGFSSFYGSPVLSETVTKIVNQ